MKKFLKETGIFLSIIVALAISFYHINQYLFQTDKVILDKRVTTLICGSSISARSLDPSIIDNSHNMSRAGRTNLDLYKILEKVLPDNPQITDVTIDYSPQGFSRRMDYFYYIPGFTQNRMKGMYPLLNYNDLKTYHVNKKIYLKSFLRYECVPNFFYLKRRFGWTKKQPPYFGKFLTDKVSAIEKVDEENVAKKIFSYDLGEGKISKHVYSTLDSVIQLTKRHDVNLWLFSGPLHERFRKIIPPEIKIAFDKEAQSVIRYDHVHFLDYTAYPLPDSCFLNLNHINYHGSQIISPLVNAEIEKSK